MMNSTSRSPEGVDFASTEWHESRSVPGVQYAIRRITLGQRIELTRRGREIARENEYLRSGDAVDQLDAMLGDLLVERMYLEWGLAAVRGLTIDGTEASTVDLIERGPEMLANEIMRTLRSYLVLTDEERKNF
jgi:hypothetical protein